MKTFQQPFTTRLAYVLISLVIIIFGLFMLKDLLIPLTFAAIFALLLLPVCQLLEKWRFPRWLAITITILITIGVLLLLFYLVYIQIMDFEEILPQLTEKVEKLYFDVQIFIRRNFHITRTQQRVEGKKYLTEFLKNNSDILIKIHVEGAELSVLEGSIRMIKKFKPDIFINLSHDEESLFKIPDFLSALGGYKLYLTGHSLFGEGITLFATQKCNINLI